MKEPGLLDKITYSLRYNDSIVHNIFFTIVVILTLVFILFILFKTLSRIFNPGSDNYEKPVKSRSKFLPIIGFWVCIFPMGLFLLIDVSLASESSAAALDKAFVYELNERPVATFLIEKFQANGTDSGMTYGSTIHKVEAVDLESGKLIFDKKLKSATYAGSDMKILCDSKDNLFVFYDAEIIVLDKATGKTVYSVNSLTEFGDAKLMESEKLCKFDKNTKSIVFKANDGQVYSMNIEGFKISEKDSIDADEYFNDKESSSVDLGQGMSYFEASEKGKFNIFLTDSDIKNLKAGVELSSSSDNTERRYLYSGNLNDFNGLKKIRQEVFLSGGFLFKRNMSDKYLYDGIASEDKNRENYVNIACRGKSDVVEPFKVEGSNLSFIVHKKSIDSRANILLTAIDLKSGETAWTLDTGACEIHECYSVDKNHILLLCEDKSGTTGANFETNYILNISLKDGTYTGREFKYGISLP